MKALLVSLLLAIVLLTGCAGGASSADGLHSTVPNVRGMELQQARDKIMDAGYRLGSVDKMGGTGRASGIVVNQDPAAGVSMSRGQDVNVTLAE
jgi:beta-lactam-binding protein with PASTA domain